MNTSRREWLGKAYGALLLGGGIGMTHGVSAQTRTGGAARVVLLGQSVPLTGGASEIGSAFAAGSRLAVSDFNTRNATTGLQLKLVQLDDGYDAARATANARTLLGAQKADLLFGFVGTASSEAGANVATQQGSLLFAPFAASDNLRSADHPNVFHVRPGMIDEALKIVRQCATVGQTRVALVGDDDAMGRAGLAAVQQAIAELKLTPLVASALVPAGGDKLDAALKDVQKQSPQAIVLVSLSGTTASAIRKLRKSGYTGNFMAFSIVGIDPLYAELGKDIGGIVISQVVPSPRPSAIPIVKEYLAAVDNSDQTASYEGLEGFIAAKAVGEAVRRAGRGFNTATLQRTMTAMTDYDVGGFRINLRPGLRDNVRSIDLISISADGRVLR
ncbi:ABC-type branched-subunit amino acid transport system substrate-binding protein [Variovorax boronicumulans]|uniref:ABC-type branched-subunit amino acid transport system substrate-binding protein n=1 Tax=Variovorax boronicumulans TaxID=436515 RepID=A0AAW8CX11_9BURK|nr:MULTISPECIES: ABC transporter substrate-binding protein [Variovorax]MDP9893721.1 ABC-type branched-subunit amino acid transport system substrate-binding protein [Variovorax boronicumulans]MDQ0034930.1 ABC-type branched-subunit amino acid transport system substrate-binding protein [Variovorax boronicumulans]MDQ0053538.1 ABC-type branched-subunit amino acid transport system substrate-binding protein [Variovorax boronicumulans]MDQ0608953.1 branched-chain amino acid transport system substrate-bi